MSLVVYSAIYGVGYDRPKPVDRVDAPCLMYTDARQTAREAEAVGWVAYVDPLGHLSSPMMRAKFWKVHPWHAAAGADVSVWVDGSLTPLDGFGKLCSEALGGDDLSLTPHPWRDCVYDELEASVGLPKYEEAPMRAQVEHYRMQGHPVHWGLFASGAMTRRHTSTVATLCADWWAEIQHWSWQDQLSLPVCVRRASSLRWNAAMVWAEPFWAYTDHGD